MNIKIPISVSLVLLPIVGLAQRSPLPPRDRMHSYYLCGVSNTGARTLNGTDIQLSGDAGRAVLFGWGIPVKFTSRGALGLDVVGVSLTGSHTSASTPAVSGGTYNYMLSLTPAARWSMPLTRSISIYGTGGAGVGVFSRPVVLNFASIGEKSRHVSYDLRKKPSLLVGGGVDYRLLPHVSVRAEIADVFTARGLSGSTGRHHVLPVIGFALHF